MLQYKVLELGMNEELANIANQQKELEQLKEGFGLTEQDAETSATTEE